jgi:hypothetical protein
MMTLNVGSHSTSSVHDGICVRYAHPAVRVRRLYSGIRRCRKREGIVDALINNYCKKRPFAPSFICRCTATNVRHDCMIAIRFRQWFCNKKFKRNLHPNSPSPMTNPHLLTLASCWLFVTYSYACKLAKACCSCTALHCTAAQARGQCTDQKGAAHLVSLSHLFRVNSTKPKVNRTA